MECANHATKNYRSALEKLVQDNPSYKGKGKLTDGMRKRLTKAARCAITMSLTRNWPSNCYEIIYTMDPVTVLESIPNAVQISVRLQKKGYRNSWLQSVHQKCLLLSLQFPLSQQLPTTSSCPATSQPTTP